MKRYSILLLAISFLGLTGCAANLVVEDATIDFSTKTVNITVKNIGNKNAGAHLTYIEINDVGAADAVKPQSQFSATVSGITAGGSWNSGPVFHLPVGWTFPPLLPQILWSGQMRKTW